MIGTAAVALAAVLGFGAADAASAATVPATPTTKPSAQDVTWMKTNAQSDLAEIALGKLALAKSHNADVRMVAKVTEKQHAAVLAKLRSLAKKEGVKLPTVPNASQRKTAAVLATFSGHKFNLNWDSAEILGHKLSITQTKTEYTLGSAGEVVDFASYYLPYARMHLGMANKLHQELT